MLRNILYKFQYRLALRLDFSYSLNNNNQCATEKLRSCSWYLFHVEQDILYHARLAQKCCFDDMARLI